jgi:hypothetical protein
MGVVVDGQLEGAEMAGRVADGPLDDGKDRDARRRQLPRLAEKDGDVELVGQQLAGLDRAFIAAINENNSLARQVDEREIRRKLGSGGEQRSHFRAGLSAFGGPAGSLAHIYKIQRSIALAGQFGKTGSLLGAPDCHRGPVLQRGAKSFGFGSA